MNREAVALGTPVWTTFAARMGAVDEGLIAEGRLRELRDAGSLVVEKKAGRAQPVMRDPAVMLDLMLDG